MARTQLKNKNNAVVKYMSDKARAFCHEYVKDHNATQAAIRAGYAKSGAQVRGAELLQRTDVRNYLGSLEKKHLDKIDMTAEDMLRELFYCATRTGADFIDPETNKLLPVHDLPIRAQHAIDGIEQEVTEIRNSDGEVIGETVKTKLRLVSKAAAIDMGMKHFGAYAAEKTETTQRVVFDFDTLIKPPDARDDVVDDRIKQVLDTTAKAIE